MPTGVDVYHPKHGRGAVLDDSGTQWRVRFSSGDIWLVPADELSDMPWPFYVPTVSEILDRIASDRVLATEYLGERRVEVARAVAARFQYRRATLDLENLMIRSGFLFDYHPWHGGRNRNHDGLDDAILKVKEGNARVARLFGVLLSSFVPLDRGLIIMPSHSGAGDRVVGLLSVARTVAELRQGELIEGVLVRKHPVMNLAIGGCRDQALLYDSLRVTDIARLQARHIVVIDDIVTTGASMQAAVRRLSESDVASVEGLAIARTS